MHVTGQVGVRIPAEQISHFPILGEQKAGGADVEMSGVEDQVSGGGNGRAGGDAVFLRMVEIVGEKPAPDVHRGCGGIEQLNGIHVRQVGVGENLVDQHRGNRWQDIRAAGGTIQRTAGPPARLVAPSGPERILVPDFE